MIVVCAVSALNVKVMLNSEHAEDMATTTLAAIGEGTPGESGESGESGGGDSGPCRTTMAGSIEWQDCDGLSMIARQTVNYKCAGKGSGTCKEGTEYTFFDCYGASITTQGRVTYKGCQ